MQSSPDARCLAFGWRAPRNVLHKTMAADQITFVPQGGAHQKAQTLAFLCPADSTVNTTTRRHRTWLVLKAQVGSGKPTRQVIDIPLIRYLSGGARDPVEKLDFSNRSNAASMPEQCRGAYTVATDCTVMTALWSMPALITSARPKQNN